MQQVGGEVRFAGPAYNAGRDRTARASRVEKARRTGGAVSRLRLVLTGALLMTVAIAAGWLFVATSNVGPDNQGVSRIDAILTAAGFGIDEVVVTGHAMTADSDIFDALDLAHVMTMPELRGVQVPARLARLPWIATASLTRVYPGRIEVNVTERTPFAVWLNAERATLIDATGRELAAVRASDLPKLPRVAGERAPDAAPALFQMLAHFPDVAARLQVASRINGRRWSLQLSEGVRLELPSEGEATALTGVLADAAGQKLLGTHDTIIDLRSRTLIASRPTGAP